MPIFNRIAVVGAGLIGGSILLAAARRGLANSYAGWSRSAEAQQTLRDFAVAEIFSTPEACVRGADLIIVATPVDRMKETFRIIKPHLTPGAIVTDAGSVKASILADAKILPKTVTFIGSHPMAGSEKAGSAHADAELFNKRLCFVTSTGREKEDDLKKVMGFWQALGSQISLVDAAEHDQIVASISHLPHASAAALMLAVQASAGFQTRAAGQGLRDATRIAAGEENLWTGIFLSNRENVVQGLTELEKRTQELKRLIESADAAGLQKFLAEARIARQALDRHHEK